MKIALEPHCDDLVLFACFTLIRERPLVISWGNKESTEERKSESRSAMQLLGLKIVFIENLDDLQQYQQDAKVVYAPSPNCCHKDHKTMAAKAKEIFGDRVIYYATYRSPKELQPIGSRRVGTIAGMEELKLKALACYPSQIKATPWHFNLENKDEYYE